jgi:membrane protein DedA with SNARE-associated domain
VVEQILTFFDRLGYGGILFFMTLESSFLPVPSELVMIPAGVLAAQGRMDPWVAIIMGIIGSWCGALINYFLSSWLGRPVLYRYGKYVLLPSHRLDKVEQFFLKHGEISTFTGRLIPAVRHLISIPAGLSRMNMGRFLLFTGLGAGLWVAVLVWVGYIAGRELKDVTTESIKQLWHQYSTPITVGLILFCAVLITLYILWYRRRHRKNSEAS